VSETDNAWLIADYLNFRNCDASSFFLFVGPAEYCYINPNNFNSIFMPENTELINHEINYKK